MSVNQRLSEFFTDQKISDKEVYSKIGVKQPVFSGWLKQGRAIPLAKIIAIITLFPNLNVRWLLTGIGSMTFDYKKPYDENNSLYSVEENKVVTITSTEFDKLLAAKDETIQSQKITIKIMSEMLGSDLAPEGDATTNGKAPKRHRVRGYGSVNDQQMKLIVKKIISEMNPIK